MKKKQEHTTSKNHDHFFNGSDGSTSTCNSEWYYIGKTKEAMTLKLLKGITIIPALCGHGIHIK